MKGFFPTNNKSSVWIQSGGKAALAGGQAPWPSNTDNTPGRVFTEHRVLWDFTFAVTVYTQKYLTRLATACPDNFAAGRDVRCNGLRTSVHRTTDRQSHCTGGHRFHLVDSVVELEEGRMGGHVHVGHFVSLVGFWLPLEYEFLRSSPLSGLMGGVVWKIYGMIIPT